MSEMDSVWTIIFAIFSWRVLFNTMDRRMACRFYPLNGHEGHTECGHSITRRGPDKEPPWRDTNEWKGWKDTLPINVFPWRTVFCHLLKKARIKDTKYLSLKQKSPPGWVTLLSVLQDSSLIASVHSKLPLAILCRWSYILFLTFNMQKSSLSRLQKQQRGKETQEFLQANKEKGKVQCIIKKAGK